MERAEQAEGIIGPGPVVPLSPGQVVWDWIRRGPLRFLYSHNPFYVISAGLIFSGLRMSFDTSSAIDVGALALGLAAYTLLLAGTAALLIRYGKVWDDTRSLLILVVLMLLGISVTLDEVLTASVEVGACYCVGGAFFAAVVSEALLRGTGLRLNSWCRVVYHLIVALFYLYPLTMATRFTSPGSEVLQWQLFGFVPLASLALLLLLPAVRGGAAAVQSPGTPWRYPWFPWVLFGVLGGCVGLRAYYLCLSLHFVGDGSSIFGPYFLVPLVLVTAVLLFEGARTAGAVQWQRVALGLPAVAAGLCLFGNSDDVVYQRFMAQYMAALGASPLYVTLLLAAGLYAGAMWRQAAGAELGWLAALGLLAVVEPTSSRAAGVTSPHALPLLVASIWLAVVGLYEWRSWRLLASCGLALVAMTQWSQGAWLLEYHGIAAAHAALLAMLVIGAVFHDMFARWTQRTAAILLGLACLVAIAGREPLFGDLPAGLLNLYPLAVVAVATSYGYLVGSRWFYAAATISLTAGVASLGVRGYDQLRHHIVGLGQLAWGIVCFVVAAAISLWKAGLLQQWWSDHFQRVVPQAHGPSVKRE